MSDNGPQFIAEQYKDSAVSCGFYHYSSSPRYPQSNGFIECVIQIVKNMLEKAKLSKEDPCLALLQLHNTPVDGRSPVYVLMGRTQRTNVPVRQNSLKSRAIGLKKFKQIHQGVRKKMKENSDGDTTKLQRLQSCQTIRFQVEPSSRWRRGTLKKPQGINSLIETGRETWTKSKTHK